MGPHVAASGAERSARQQHLQQAESDFEILPFDAQRYEGIRCCRGSFEASGGAPAARAYDALIAAGAVAYGVPLYTCNPSDFVGIPKLELRSVTHPDLTS